MPTGIISIILNALRGRVATVIQHGITAGCLWLVAHGVSQAQSNDISSLLNPTAIAGAVIGVLNILLDAWSTHAGNKLINAVTTGAKGGQVLGSVGKASSVILAFLLLGASAKAQTTNALGELTTNSPGLLSVPLLQIGASTNTATAVNDVASWVSPLLPYLTNHSITLDAAPLYGQGKFGELAALRVPVTQSSPLSLGIGEAYADNLLFIAPVSVSVGTAFTIPVINRQVYTFAGSGLALQVKGLGLGDESVVGGVTSWDLNSQLELLVEGGYVKLTQLTGNDWFFGLSLNWHPKNW